jgi:peptidoglycan/LPS O-acetylase OafA/YrhL
MYAALTALGFLGVLRPGRRFWIFSAAFFTWILALVWFPDLFEDASDHDHLRRLAICFFVGVLFDRIKNHLPLNAAGVGLAFAICWGASRLESISAFYSFIEAFALGYGVFWFALRPKGGLLHYDRLGDYSYGLYLYAFPVQQLLVWIHPQISFAEMLIGATIVSLAFAVVSWHLLENPILKLARRVD